MILENNVSILIPVFNNVIQINKAIESALASNVTEIIISDNHSTDGTLEILYKIKDPRVKIIQPPSNIGIWKNHLFLLKHSTKDWIKFLQADDYLEKGCLEELCSYANEETTLIGGLPIYEDLSTGVRKHVFYLKKALFFNPEIILSIHGYWHNLFGRPSYTLIKKSAIDVSEEAWENDKSADMIMNIVCIAQGKCVLLPPGKIICGIHPNQDGNTQSQNLALLRNTNTIKYLKDISSTKKTAQIIESIQAIILPFQLIKAFIRKNVEYRIYKSKCIDFIFKGLPSIFIYPKVLIKHFFLIRNIKKGHVNIDKLVEKII